MDKLVEATVDYSGAELEQAVIASLYDAFDTGNDLTTEGLLDDAAATSCRSRSRCASRSRRCASGPGPAPARRAARGRAPAKKAGLDGAPRRPDVEPRRQGSRDRDDGERKLEL